MPNLALLRTWWLRRPTTNPCGRRPDRPFSRPSLERLEDRLPPGDMLLAALLSPFSGFALTRNAPSPTRCLSPTRRPAPSRPLRLWRRVCRPS